LTMTDVTDIQQGPEGCWYTNNTAYSTNGKIVRICPTGFSVSETVEGNRFTVYPNPANEYVNVTGKNIERIELMDLNGRIVLSTLQQTFDVSGLAPGIYQLRINGISVEKLIRE